MAWLVTGGAGYIGAHVVRAFIREGMTPVVLDDLSSGYAKFVPEGVPLVRAQVQDTAAVATALRKHDVEGVVHVAGYKYAGASVLRPLHAYAQNVQGTASVLQAMEDEGVSKLVFSSSAAVYGTPETLLVTEDTPTRPESPYGESKLIGEWVIGDQARALASKPGAAALRHVSLRYFNVVGSGTDEVFDASPHNLFPLVFEALRDGRTPRINGNDYPTPDGTCVRDYVHVADLATSHVAAAQALLAGRELRPVYNLGSGDGLSVQQIMDAVRRNTGRNFQPEICGRRAGDPARIVADGTAASRDLDWKMRHSIDEMVISAWNAHHAR